MIRRLILRLDSATAERASLADYAALAEALNAELLTELEDDSALDQLAALGFITEVCRASAAVRPLDPERLERRSTQLMRRLNARLEQIARQRTLQWSLARVGQADRTVPGRDEAELQPGLTTARPLAPTQRRGADRAHIAVIHGGDEASERALEYARRIAQPRALPILLLALPDSVWHRRHELPPGVAVRTDLASCASRALKPLLRAWHVSLLLMPSQLSAADPSRPNAAGLGVPLLLTP